jgi:ribosomal-protein-alanine N-acetyltransferase
VIRPATAGHAAAIAGLEAALFGVDAWSAEQVGEELAGFGAGFVLCVGEELVGYVVTRTIGDVSDLQRIAVSASYQRRGAASRLLDAALAGARQAGAVRMLLEVAEDNKAALRFYAQRGFAEIDRRARYYRSGAAAIVMAADLFPEGSGSAVAGG